MKWWQGGLLVGCLAMLILLCGGGLMGGVWYYRTAEITQTADEATLIAPTPDEAAGADGLLPSEERPPSVPPNSRGEEGRSEALSENARNRILVLGTDGNVFTVSPEGEARVQLTDNASRARKYRYPTWSPDGRMIAFVEVLTNEDSLDSALHVVSPDGQLKQEVPTQFPPFYLFWNPTGEKLTFLSNWTNGMALRMVDVAGGATEATTLQEGMPFFFSWEPTGNTMLAHIGGDLLTFLDLSGELAPLDIATGPFQAPHWSADGQKLAFVSEGEKRENLLSVSNPQGEEVMEVTRQRGLFSFNWSPDNQRIAYSYSQQTIGLGAFGPLWVHDTTTNQAWELSNEPVVAFFWSPDGQRLAFLRPELHEPVKRVPEAAPLRQNSQLWLRWHIWNGERTYPLTIFQPTDSFLADYLRYFDQYAQSTSLWSPDSQMLLYAGLSERGLSGIWALPVKEGSSAHRVAGGELATWSPH
ncbi:MAG: TolB family protein [Ardenticatenaceae bacterium]